jgi:hypothetical protein
MSAFLTACGTPQQLQCADPFLQPTRIEGKYQTTDELMADPESTTRDLVDHSGQGDDALKRANDDKRAARVCLGEKP